jgi:hypothetical protein
VSHALLAIAVTLLVPQDDAAPAPNVLFVQSKGVVHVLLEGEPFTTYHYADGAKPYLFPVLGPGGAAMTRQWPMAEGPNEEHDHPHQRSLWYAHGDVNGHDFWAEGEGKGRIEHRAIESVKAGPAGTLRVANDWVAADGTLVCTEVRTMVFRATDAGREIDFTIALSPAEGDLHLGDTKEGSMAIRLTPTLRLDGPVGAGHIKNSAGHTDGECWGKRAAWVDYWGPVAGQTLGVAMFDHPKNPAHPTWWHARKYGLFAANPFGVHDFERKPEGTGDQIVPAGKTITFRYRLLLHGGEVSDVALNNRLAEFEKD